MIKNQISFFIKDTYRGNASDPLSLNLYTYCANNPLIYWDPTGHSYLGKYDYEAQMWYLAEKRSGKSSYQLRDVSNDPIVRAVDGASIVFNSKKRKEAFESIDTNGSTSDKIMSRVYAGTGVGATAVAATATVAYTAQFVPALTGYLGTGATKAYIAVEGWLSSALGRVTAGYVMANPDVGFDVYNTFQDVVNRNFGALPMDGLSFAYNSLDYNIYKYTKNRNYNNIEQTQVQKDYNDYMKNSKTVNIEVDNSNISVSKPSKNNKNTVVEPVVSDNTGVGNTKIYRKMSIEEATATIEQRKLQPAISGKDPTKWTTTSLAKVTQPEKLGGFNNHGVLKGTTEVVVEFELSPNYFEYMQKTAVPQRGSKKLPNIKYHFEKLPKNGPDINYGITPEELERLNLPDNLLNVKIIDGTTKVK